MVFVVPANVRPLLRATESVQSSVDELLATWSGGDTPNNIHRRQVLESHLPQLEVREGLHTQYAFLNARGDGSCFYGCVYMAALMRDPAIVARWESLEAFQAEVIHLIPAELIRLHGCKSMDDARALMHDFELFDPNCPNIEVPLIVMTKMLNWNACVIRFPYEPVLLKYTNEGTMDSILLFENEGHYRLIVPFNTHGTNAELRTMVHQMIESVVGKREPHSAPSKKGKKVAKAALREGKIEREPPSKKRNRGGKRHVTRRKKKEFLFLLEM